jgi:hypothetical protein
VLTGTTAIPAGDYACSLIVDDTFTSGTATASFTVTVDTTPAVAALAAQTVHVGRPISYDISGLITDPDGIERTSLTYTVVENGQNELPDWLTFTPATQIFTGTPLLSDGPHTIDVKATDIKGISSTISSFVLTLTPNNAPVYTPLDD